jgi:GTP cyclohydrolase I
MVGLPSGHRPSLSFAAARMPGVDAERFDHDKIEQGVRLILEGVGEDVARGGLKDTPSRVARMYEEILAGIGFDPTQIVTVVEGADFDEMIMVRDIPLTSLCEHHMVPFNGRAHVAYVPNKSGQITGLSKIARVVDVLAKRLQVQERLTTQIAETVEQALDPRGVFVVIEAEHLCMTMRGIKKPGAVTVTSAVRGLFRTDARTRQEAMNHIGMR